MIKKNLFYVLLIIGLISCNSYEKAPSGMLYKIKHLSGKKEKINPGDWVKINITYNRKRGDTTLMTTEGFFPTYVNYDTLRKSPFSISELLPKAYVGDKIEFIIDVDSLVVQGFQYNPILGIHDKIIAKAEIIKKFSDNTMITADNQEEMTKFKRKEAKEIKDFITKKNIKAQEIENGIFVEMIKEGDKSKPVDSGKNISVTYTGRLMKNDSVFDSNNSIPFDSSRILTYQQDVDQLIPGWNVGMKSLSKGAKAKIYIPSLLAYGQRGAGMIGPFENIYFEIEVLDVTTPPKIKATANPLGAKTPNKKKDKK
ncbi:MAG: FKBP-type peptidyl-prolyl cis-trans isomerase [Sediminibacterium sp.]|nr:FKBP-type peptidyl-prolyl cis-trans isomerase [Sediminibacterium sp.]